MCFCKPWTCWTWTFLDVMFPFKCCHSAVFYGLVSVFARHKTILVRVKKRAHLLFSLPSPPTFYSVTGLTNLNPPSPDVLEGIGQWHVVIKCGRLVVTSSQATLLLHINLVSCVLLWCIQPSFSRFEPVNISKNRLRAAQWHRHHIYKCIVLSDCPCTSTVT